jgi:putative ABC transport system substrate-binding protein
MPRGQEDRLPTLAAELVGLKADIIVTNGTRATRAAKNATKTIPIVMAYDLDPIGSGYVDSLARPGGNITGLTNVSHIARSPNPLIKHIFPALLQR